MNVDNVSWKVHCVYTQSRQTDRQTEREREREREREQFFLPLSLDIDSLLPREIIDRILVQCQKRPSKVSKET
jgi:hypothetical protein